VEVGPSALLTETTAIVESVKTSVRQNRCI
jgi:hypothetical protein